MRRQLFGILGLLLLVAWASLLLFQSTNSAQALAGGCLRGGLLLSAIWLAYNQVEQFIRHWPWWLSGYFGIAVLAIVIRPQMIVVVGPLLLVLMLLKGWNWLLTPPPKSPAGKHPSSSSSDSDPQTDRR